MRSRLILLGWLVSISVSLAPAGAESAHTTAAGCESCHAAIHKLWSQSRHSKMVQPATKTAVQGDFTRGRITLRGQEFNLTARNGVFYITDSYLNGKPEEHRIDYTLGNRRIQHYLSKLADGRIIVLPPSWDIVRKQWFHNLDIDDPDEAPGVQVQIWNKNCYSCHVSQEEKNFDPLSGRYSTAWLDFGTNCERCHGAGRAHVERYKTGRRSGAPDDIVMPNRLDAAGNTQVCAQCHSLRDIYATGYAAGANYYDFFLPILEFDYPTNGDPAYFADGRTRRFSNDAAGLWQSECYLQGHVTCVNCHREPHDTDIDQNPQLHADRNQLCTGCHTSLSSDKEQALAQHTHHAAGSAGRSCVECHMPRTVTSIKAQIRDHSMSIPVPENTISHNIPNACNACHQDRDADWALARMKAWYGESSRREKLIRRADAFSSARKDDPGSIPLLLAILGNAKEGPYPRANAAGHLRRFSYDPIVFAALERAVEDPDPLVRAVAVLNLRPGPADRSSAIPLLTKSLGDPAAIVRMGAVASLVSLGVHDVPGEAGEQFKRAKAAFAARAAHYSDDATQQIAAGRFYLLAGDPAHAVDALELSRRLNPEAAIQYLLGYAYAQRGEISRAREILSAIPSADPQYNAAQKLLDSLASLH
jgi:predicted CXXCH cytochrome family protein